MIPTDSNYQSTISIDEIRTEVLEQMLIYMQSHIKKIGNDIETVQSELNRR